MSYSKPTKLSALKLLLVVILLVSPNSNLQAELQQCSDPSIDQYCYDDLPLEIGDEFYWDFVAYTVNGTRANLSRSQYGSFIDELQIKATINATMAYQTLPTDGRSDYYRREIIGLEGIEEDDYGFSYNFLNYLYLGWDRLIVPTLFQEKSKELPINSFHRLLGMDMSETLAQDNFLVRNSENWTTSITKENQIIVIDEDWQYNRSGIQVQQTHERGYQYQTGFLLKYLLTEVYTSNTRTTHTYIEVELSTENEEHPILIPPNTNPDLSDSGDDIPSNRNILYYPSLWYVLVVCVILVSRKTLVSHLV